MTQQNCIACRVPDADPDCPVCNDCERRYPRLLIAAALADSESREAYLAKLTTGMAPPGGRRYAAARRSRS
jgi:hypothetical protein